MIKTTLKHASRYFAGTAITAVIGLVMNKYYTRIFMPEEYGVLALYLVFIKYIQTIISLNMDSGSTRVYFDYKGEQRNEYLSTIFWFITFMSVVTVIAGL